MSLESGLKLIASAERGITSDGERTIGAKTAKAFRATGTREVLEATGSLEEALKHVTLEMVSEMEDYYKSLSSNVE